MMDKGLQVFDFENHEVRVVMQGEEPWFVAKDVCDVLELSNAREAIKTLDDDEKSSVRISDGTSPAGGNPNMNIISESGLYTLIMRSHKPEAKRFRKWVTAEVLPSIRKHGAYLTPEALKKAMTDPDFTIGLLEALKAEQLKNAALSAQAAIDHPKVLFADAVSESQTSILIGDLAKLLRQNNVNIGQNRLFRWLRENGYLIKRQGASYNMPTQAAMEKELFEVVERVYNLPDGSTRITRTVKVTGKGQVYFISWFLGIMALESEKESA